MNHTRSARFAISLLLGAGALQITLADEQRQQASRQSASGTSGAPKIDLNTADVKTLAAIPEIGPHLAPAIVAARPFATIDELDRVKGINAEQLEQIRAKVIVAPASKSVREMLAGKASNEPSRASGSAAQKIDVNTADLKTLESIPSIGPEAARALVAARPFASLDDLSRVQGISAERLEQIRAVVAVSTPASASKNERTKQKRP